MSVEKRNLPSSILATAIESPGKEFGWRKQDFIETVLAAKSVGLGIIGGQVQFVLPEGTCELYWLNYETLERADGEPWEIYCERTAKEVIAKFERLIATTDFVNEGINSFDFLKEKAGEGVDLVQYLTFILYFAESSGK